MSTVNVLMVATPVFLRIYWRNIFDPVSFWPIRLLFDCCYC